MTMLTRRTTLAGAVALAATAALPSALLADGLTTEERRLMALVPPHVDAAGRAHLLEGLRDPDPHIRECVKLLLEMTPRTRRAALAFLEQGQAVRITGDVVTPV